VVWPENFAMIRYTLLVLVSLGLAGIFSPQSKAQAKPARPATKSDQTNPPPAIDLERAKAYFAEARRLAEADGGKLWGKSLAGPVLFVDPRTRFAVANQADAEGTLKGLNGVFTATLPAKVPLANTAYRWSGTHWSMVLWPLPTEKAERATLLMHESWHRIQADLGLPSIDPANPHLDSLAGRYWLQLEWRALARALHSVGEDQVKAMEDALSFRLYRRKQFAGSATTESVLELHEGLAEYTGVKLSGLIEGEQRRLLVKRLQEQPAQIPSFIRSFAYLSGPAYGLLLDEYSQGWRARLKPGNDLAMILAKEINLKMDLEPETAIKQRAARYDAEKLWAAESAREQNRLKKVADFRQQLIDGPVLVIPLSKQQMSFNPSLLVPIEGAGTVYPTLTLIGPWGKLVVHKASLIASDFKKATVPAPFQTEEATLKGDGWELRLEPGWKAKKGERNGDWILANNN